MAKFERNESLLSQYAQAIVAGGGTANANFDNVEIRDMNEVGFKSDEIFKVDKNQKYLRKVTVGGTTREVPVLLVTMADGRVKELYLSMLTRSVQVCDEAGKLTGQTDETRGTAIDEWKKYKIATLAVDALDGKFIKVKNRRQPWRLVPNPTNGEMRPRRQTIYDFAFCDENGKEL